MLIGLSQPLYGSQGSHIILIGCLAFIFRPPIFYMIMTHEGFPSGSVVKEMQEMWVHSLGWEDPLEEGTATHSSITAWRILCTEDRGGLQSIGSQRVGHY